MDTPTTVTPAPVDDETPTRAPATIAAETAADPDVAPEDGNGAADHREADLPPGDLPSADLPFADLPFADLAIPGAFEQLAEAHRRTVERLATAQRATLDGFRRMQAVEIEYGGRLIGCGSPAEAIEVIGHWAAARLDVIVDSQRAMRGIATEAVAAGKPDTAIMPAAH